VPFFDVAVAASDISFPRAEGAAPVLVLIHEMSGALGGTFSASFGDECSRSGVAGLANI
jgi:hypothetical protein